MRDIDVDALEIVGARPANRNVIDCGDARRSWFNYFVNHGHSLLSDRWAGIANRIDNQWKSLSQSCEP